jgi:60 kDa SS-A/Ro ribonucleoprotein
MVGPRESKLVQIVMENGLPWEQVSSHINTKECYKALLMYPKAPYMWMMRNLNNFQKRDVFGDKECVEYAVKVLTDPVRIAKSKQFPFRFYSAIRAFNGDQRIVDALYQAMDLSVGNMPEIGATVLVCNDVSGSMGHPISGKSNITMMDIAGIFAAACFKSAENGKIVSFNDSAILRRVYKKDSVMTITEKVSQGGGGTQLSAPIQALTKLNEKVDTAIFITDSESWVEFFHGNESRWGQTRHEGGKISLDHIRQYKRKVNPDLKCFFMQLAPYDHAVVPPGEPNCYYMYGWSPNVLRYISSICKGGSGQVETIRNMELLATPESEEETVEEE